MKAKQTHLKKQAKRERKHIFEDSPPGFQRFQAKFGMWPFEIKSLLEYEIWRPGGEIRVDFSPRVENSVQTSEMGFSIGNNAQSTTGFLRLTTVSGEPK